MNPVMPDTSTNKTFYTPSGKGVTVGAGGQTFSYDQSTNTIRPSLNATFPTAPEGTKSTSVVTSKPAIDNNQKIGNELKQATTDLGNHTASISQNQTTPATKTDTTDYTKLIPSADLASFQKANPGLTFGAEDYQKYLDTKNNPDSQINDLMKTLGYDTSETAQLTPEQKQTIVADEQAIGLDNSQLDPTNPSSVASIVSQMLNGTYPLSTTEQASINNLKTQFQGALTDAQQYAKNIIGGGEVSNAKNGFQMYSPSETISNMQKVVKEGNDKIQTINTRILDAQNKLTQTLKDGDFKQANDLYTKISDDLKLRTTEINDINKSVLDMTKQMHDDARANATLQLNALIHDDTKTYQEKQQAISQATLDEKTRHDKMTELNGGTPGGIMSDSPSTPLPSVNMNGDGTVNTSDQQSFLSSLPGGANGEIATLVKGIANYSINPSSIPTRQYKGVGNVTQSQILAKVAQYDPSFSQSNYANRQALNKNFQSGTYSQNINSLNTATAHMSSLLTAVNGLGNVPLPTVNWVKNTAGGLVGWGAPGQAKLDMSAVTDEIGAALKKSGVTDNDIKTLTQLDANSSPDQVKKYIEGAVSLLSGRLGALTDTYTAGMGKAPDSQFLHPQAIQALSQLKNQGIKVDIPGVLYTDKDAYLNNGGSADSLAKARQDLISANDPKNPATPENILQLAQIKY